MRRLRSARTWIALGVIAPAGMLVVSGLMPFDLLMGPWEKAEQTSGNLLRDISRNVAVFDPSLQAVVDNLRAPDLGGVDHAMRQPVLFDRAATAQDMGDQYRS